MAARSSKPVITLSEWVRTGLRRAALAHFFLLGAYALQTIVMDAWRIIVPEIVMERWIAGALLFCTVAVVWYLAHNVNNDLPTLKRLTFTLITADIIFIAYNVFIQRGMASKSVALFIIPIALAAILLSRSAVYAAAALSTAGYIIATVSYFTLHFNEGYKTELYAEVAFYSAVFFAFSMLLSNIIRFGGNTENQ